MIVTYHVNLSRITSLYQSLYSDLTWHTAQAAAYVHFIKWCWAQTSQSEKIWRQLFWAWFHWEQRWKTNMCCVSAGASKWNHECSQAKVASDYKAPWVRGQNKGCFFFYSDFWMLSSLKPDLVGKYVWPFVWMVQQWWLAKSVELLRG